MNALKALVTSLGILALSAAAVKAQGDTLQLQFNGTCRTTNSAGMIIKQIVNNRSLLKDYAQSHSVSNLNTLALVYQSQGDERGDVIRIVDARTGAVLTDVMALFFSVDLPQGDGSMVFREVSLFNSQQSFEIGSGMLTEQLLNRKGSPDHHITGTLQYYLLPTDTNTLRLCTATINTLKTFTPKGTPGTNAVATTMTSRQILSMASNP
jgi:hypothetical protein